MALTKHEDTTSLGAHDLRRVAVTAIADTATVARYLRGGAVRSTSRARIEAALAALGLLGHLRPSQPFSDAKRAGARAHETVPASEDEAGGRVAG
jgi:hypothetical protein